MAQQVYAEDYSCIIDSNQGVGGLYIGNLEAAQNLPNLKRLQVKAILSAAKGVDLGYSRTEIPYFLHIPVNDHEACDIGKFFHQAANFINDCLERTNIIVHCLAGVSRSVSLVISYLIKHKGHSFQSAFDMIKARRRIIHPNDGFIQQLKKFQKDFTPSTLEPRSLSSSPSKRHLYRESSLSSSPTKKYAPSREIQAIIEKYESYKATSMSAMKKNPESALDLRKIQSYQEPSMTDASQFRCKRIASMNGERKDLYDSKNDYGSYNRRKPEMSPLDSIQNRQYQRQTDIDKKIEEIRKKYQDYKSPAASTIANTPAIGGSMAGYGRFSSANMDENSSSGRPGSFGLEQSYGYGRQAFCGDIAKTRLKKLTSLQDY